MDSEQQIQQILHEEVEEKEKGISTVSQQTITEEWIDENCIMTNENKTKLKEALGSSNIHFKRNSSSLNSKEEFKNKITELEEKITKIKQENQNFLDKIENELKEMKFKYDNELTKLKQYFDKIVNEKYQLGKKEKEEIEQKKNDQETKRKYENEIVMLKQENEKMGSELKKTKLEIETEKKESELKIHNLKEKNQ